LNTLPDIDEFVINNWLPKDKKYFGINSGAAFGPAKRWRPDYFAKVINYISKKYDFIPVLFGAENERQIGAEILRNLDDSIKAINLIGKTSLQQLFSAIKQCKLFLTNDSGPMHIAAAFDIPLVAVFGSTNAKTTGPFSDYAVVIEANIECSPCIEKTCKFNTYQCMKVITPELVIEALEKKCIFKGN